MKEHLELRQRLEIGVTGHEAGYYLRHIQLVHGGKRCRALGSRIFSRDQRETFHEFLVFISTLSIGEEWRKRQAEKPESEWHYIFKCYVKYYEWREKNKCDDELRQTGRYSGSPDGYTQYLICLAFDLYALQQTGQLQKGVLDRLKLDGDTFQGARYEIAVASIFARAGFNIDFYDEHDPTKWKGMRHCEFIATDPGSGVKIAVEAKSRHRPGILHDSRPKNDDRKYLRGDIHPLLRDALGKEVGDNPYMIFIDLNAKPTPEIEFTNKPWIKDIDRVVKQNIEEGPPEKANLIAVTNFSYHYQGEAKAERGEVVYVLSPNPKFAIPEEVRNKLLHVINKYGLVPDLDTIIQKIGK